MNIKRSVTILLPDDHDLRATVAAFQRVQQQLAEPCYNRGQPLSAIALHHAMYAKVIGTLNSQMTCSAIRLTAGAYVSARSNSKPAQSPFQFHKARALFLVGARGRDADFRTDGTLSIWTVAGRKHISYTVPKAFQATLAAATEIDSLTVIERHGRLLGRVTVTLDAPEPVGIHPVGVDLLTSAWRSKHDSRTPQYNQARRGVYGAGALWPAAEPDAAHPSRDSRHCPTLPA